MSKITLEPNNSGSGTFTIAAPNSNNNRQIDLPDLAGTVLTDATDLEPQVKTSLNATGDAPMFACRAHINFSGYTMSIHGSGNISSIVDRGVGLYTVNFQTDMPTSNYTAAGIINSWGPDDHGGRTLAIESVNDLIMEGDAKKFVGSIDLIIGQSGGEERDAEDINLLIVT